MTPLIATPTFIILALIIMSFMMVSKEDTQMDIQGISSNDVKWCENYRCKRHKVPVAFPPKRCSMCNAKMRPLTTDELKQFVGQLVIDDSPRSADELQTTLPIITNPSPDPNPTERKPPAGYIMTGSSVQRSPNNSPGYTPSPSHSPKKGGDTWGCDTAEVKGECPIYKAAPPHVIIPNQFFMDWVWMAKRVNTEWMAYMIGKEEREGDQIVWTVTDFYFPKQVVAAAHVEAEDNQVRDGVIGSVHSHVQMNAFFSAEDEKHMNHPCELVLNAKSDIKASIRVPLECGRFSRVEGKVYLTAREDLIKLHKDLEALMTERKYSQGGHSHHSSSPNSSSYQSERGYSMYGLDGLDPSDTTWKC